MPTVHIEMFAGRDLETKRKICAAVTEAITSTCGVPVESVAVVLSELQPENYSKAGVMRIDSMKK